MASLFWWWEEIVIKRKSLWERREGGFSIREKDHTMGPDRSLCLMFRMPCLTEDEN